MIRRLVEEENVGVGGEHAGERRAPCLAAGDLRGVFVAAEAEIAQEHAGTIGIGLRIEPGFGIGEHGLEPAEVRLLRQVAQAGSRLQEAYTLVRLKRPCGNPEQRRFARAVAADQANLIASANREIGGFKQRRAAERQRDVLQV